MSWITFSVYCKGTFAINTERQTSKPREVRVVFQYNSSRPAKRNATSPV